MHYYDGQAVEIGDVATRAPSPGEAYDGGLVDGEGGTVVDVTPEADACNVRLAAVTVHAYPYEGLQVLHRRGDVDGKPVVTLGGITYRTCTARALRLVRRGK
jgi:hypothetical protein